MAKKFNSFTGTIKMKGVYIGVECRYNNHLKKKKSI